MADFEEYESRERKFLDWYVTTKKNIELINVSPIGSFDRKDFTAYSGRTFIMGEIKIRNISYNKYPTVILELDKIQSLTKLFEKEHRLSGNTAKLLYYAVYPNSRKVLIFDILRTAVTLSFNFSPITTTDKSRGYVWKTMANYKLEDALEIIEF